MLDTATRALPWLPGAIRAVLPSTPLAFQRFARRTSGWVGGFPQRHPFVGWPTEIVPGLYLVGDSVFPGQSIPATALAGLRAARRILRELGADLVLAPQEPSVHLPTGEGEPVMAYR
jgi:phytoene dehydrogenase-like protein